MNRFDTMTHRGPVLPSETTRTLNVAICVPCHNEEITIGEVIADFRATIPGAVIYVYDNNSTDRTAERARMAGAIVRQERLQGKGNVVRRMFADIEADAYILVDGDATYDASAAGPMLDLLLDENLDMVNGARAATADQEAYRLGHRFGNRLLTRLVAFLFGAGIDDMLSGYKVLSRRLVKSIPLLSAGFEIETELAVHALSLRMPFCEFETPYRERPMGSASKLNTFRDGTRILRIILLLLKEERPLSFFSLIAVALAGISVGLSAPLVVTFFETGQVLRMPTAVLAASTMLLAFLSLTCGLILDSVSRGRREMKRMAYLAADTRSPRREAAT
jgi:glycosyltransferase involved in cell wall biosynthesis